MSGVQCNKCGSTNIDTDSPCGNVVCIACGNVLDESNIVQEVQFVQDSRGVSRAVGQLVSFEDGMSYGLGHGFGSGRESRAITIQNARRNIENLASRLQLKPPAVENALNYYKLALSKHLTKGRKNAHVIAACVYMVCRRDGTSHMLLDLSDVLKINVYELGKTYLKLSTELHINTPAIDPVLYIARFARQLQFGDKENEVAVTATKLVRRMKSDWIHFGRRPSGLCGAALLVAARLHNFNRTIDDIIKVVKVCQATVRKRLTEFGDTPSGKLSIEDFMTVDLSEEQDPPSFKNARRKLRELEDEGKLKELENQVTEFQKVIEKILENTRKRSIYAKYAELDNTDDLSQASTSSTRNVDMLIAENTLDSIKDVIGQDESEVNNLVPLLAQEGQFITDCVTVTDDEYNGKGLTPTLECIGLGSKNTENKQAASTPDADADHNLDLTGIDDSELDRYFMKPSEYMKKDEVWHKFNADYLEELREREERKALEEEENAKKPPKKKRTVKKRDPIQANSAGEAMSKVFQQKRISHKLNYDILKSLTPGNCLDDLVEPEPETDPKTESNPPSVKSVRVRPKVKPALSSVHLNIKKGMSDIIGNSRRKTMSILSDSPSTSEDPPAKKAKISETAVLGGNAEKDAFDIDNLITKNHVPVTVEEDEVEEEDLEEEYGFSDDDGPVEYDYDKFIEDQMCYD
ncbi:transcription factor IIIB 90 kDa subunit-like [Argiope bruennichi]|uniref:transcription factor IIIB 90 kDa subunit-like n=1 Tax=Argiope bruennichi TaxID=94029 RepID=UPI0024943515|nr:transcription factor IIIB 90 kDa subunit-like [Argiope bruennichi]